MTRGTLVVDLPEEDYHARRELSATGVKQLVKSAADFDLWRSTPEKPKHAFDVGTAMHAKVLGVGAGIVAYPPEHLTPSGNVSEKQATKDWAAEQRALGFVPVSPDDAARVDAMAEAVLRKGTQSRKILDQDADREASVFNRDPETGVEIRARFDFLPRDNGKRRIAADLKKVRSATKRGFAFEVRDWRYDVQEPHYLHTWDTDGDDSLEFVFIGVEEKAPHHVIVGVLNEDFKKYGREEAARARRLYAACMASGVWPGYPDEIQLIEPPMSYIYDRIDAEEDAQ